MSSPSERYAAFRSRQRLSTLTEFAEGLSFDLDPFQREGCEAVASGRSVLVAAPTGAGKTVVGEFAVYHARQQGLKAFYTTPIKALSNQKFHDLVQVYGDSEVGLLTGDSSINSNAPIVVMTTEVLRNMIYASSPTLDSLGVVVLDEVHYLADRFRGSVWEEVIVHAAQSTALVALSATVSNAEEFGAWLTEVRGDTEVIVSEHRPVPLWPHILVREGLYDLYAPDVDPTRLGSNPPVNPELVALAKRQRASAAHYGRHRGRHRPPGRRMPPRFAVVDVLDANALLPAIVFIFSRAGCEDAVDQVHAAGMTLTTAEERAQIARIIDERCAGVPSEDLAALGFAHWRDHCEAGIAAHHAGMIPLFKEVVEELFAAGLIKVVYATETLALGINMPARSVVLEKLVKWDGQAHQDLTPGEYTQLTGRAGRRGIDIEGHAVVVEHPDIDVEHVARLASRRTYPLISSFQPSYNMAVNLVSTVGAQSAREVLEMSFAQYQADRSVVTKAARVRELDAEISGYREAAACERGDSVEYSTLRHRLSRLEKQGAQERGQRRREASAHTLTTLRRGDVVRIRGGKRTGLVVVVSADPHPEHPRPTVISDKARSFKLSVADLPAGLERVGTLRLRGNIDTSHAPRRREIAQQLSDQRHSFREANPKEPRREDNQIAQLRSQLRSHPVHECPDRDKHARWMDRYHRSLREKDVLVTSISQATGSIARMFDRRCTVLEHLEYLERDGDTLTVTDSGTMLTVVFSENDLAIAQALRTGAWEGLHAPALAGALSAMIYNGRRDDDNRTPRIPGGPQGALGRALEATQRIWSDIDDLHRRHRLPPTPAMHLGMVGPIHAWAQGKSLDAVLSGADIAPGDMVRWTKQVIDVLDQVAQVAPQESVRTAARTAIAAMRRGVIAY